MNCAYSKEMLALYVEGDLRAVDAEKVRRHVTECGECGQYCEQLLKTQSFLKARLKSSRQDAVTPQTLASVRRAVLSQIDRAEQTLGWAVKLERLIMLGFRGQRYALAGFAIVAVVSASLLGQMRHSWQELNTTAAVFIGKDTLVCPAGYRQWIFAGSSDGCDSRHNVYINPAAYREYVSTGKFPDGTVMVSEAAGSESALQVSVKDSSRFDGGWGYFNFTDAQGKLKAKALPEESGCRSCHQERAETDHVFTQYYPLLRLATPRS